MTEWKGIAIWSWQVQCPRPVTQRPTHEPLFTKQYKLVPVNDGDALKLGR